MAVFYTMILFEVLKITTTLVLEQITSEERAQVERRKIIGSNSFETTWTMCFRIPIYTSRGGRRKGKVFLLKQCQQTGPRCSHTLFSHYRLPPSVGQKWHFAGLFPRKQSFLLPRISPWTLWQLLHEGLWASLPIHFLKGNRNLLLQD